MSRWGNHGIFETDIHDEFPLADLRSPSLSETLVCLVVVPAQRLDVGIKILSAFGFTYRDILVPRLDGGGMSLIRSERVVLRGERGASRTPSQIQLLNAKVEDILEFAEAIGQEPRILVFEESHRAGWTCLTS